MQQPSLTARDVQEAVEQRISKGLYALAQRLPLVRSIAAELGFSVEAVSTGGASDASLVAGAGVPVLDGLGQRPARFPGQLD